jgi:hypothetical protein
LALTFLAEAACLAASSAASSARPTRSSLVGRERWPGAPPASSVPIARKTARAEFQMSVVSNIEIEYVMQAHV